MMRASDCRAALTQLLLSLLRMSGQVLLVQVAPAGGGCWAWVAAAAGGWCLGGWVL
jgi:hypothetical protein